MDTNNLLYDCYNYLYSKPNKAASYTELHLHIESLKKYELETQIIHNVKLNDLILNTYQILTGNHLLMMKNDFVRFLSYGHTETADFVSRIDTFKKTVNQSSHSLLDIFPNHNEFNKSSDTDIYILSLKLFHSNWVKGVSYFEYKHYILNVVKIDILNERLRILYIEITKQPHMPDMNEPKIASLESMLGLLEYEELQHSLEESRSAKVWSLISLGLAIGTFIIGCYLTIHYSNEQIKIAKEQFRIEQNQYIKDHPTVKDSIRYTPKPLQYINPK